MKLLVVEDNERLLDRVQRQLGKFYLIDTATNGQEALTKAQQTDYGVIVLDLGLPDIPGLDVCKQLRALHIDAPILVLTGVDTIAARIELLESGADDYVTKPFDSGELRARITALSRRQPLKGASKHIVHNDLIIDPDRRTVTRGDVHIPLRRKEFDILEYLVNNSGRVMTREMIMNQAWNASGKSGWNSTVDVHIKNLRDKIDRPFATSIIQTAHGLGYRVDMPHDLTERKELHSD